MVANLFPFQLGFSLFIEQLQSDISLVGFLVVPSYNNDECVYNSKFVCMYVYVCVCMYVCMNLDRNVLRQRSRSTSEGLCPKANNR